MWVLDFVIVDMVPRKHLSGSEKQMNISKKGALEIFLLQQNKLETRNS